MERDLKKIYSGFPYLAEYYRLLIRRQIIRHNLNRIFTKQDIQKTKDLVEIIVNGELKTYKIIRKN